MWNLKLNQPVWYSKVKKKAVVKEFLANGLVRITYFDGFDKRITEDVLHESLRKFKEKDTILFAKIRPDAIIPSKRYEDGCYDVYANFEKDEFYINKGRVALVPTGIASSFSPKYRINCARERGSTGKIGLQVLSGQIDSGYRGEWFIALHNSTNHTIVISKKHNEAQSLANSASYDPYIIYYPYSKAICQAALELVPDVNIQEITYEELEKIPSERGKTKLGQSGK